MSRRQAIGFDRKIELDWLDAIAAKVAEGMPEAEVRAFVWKFLEGVVSGDTSRSARDKTVTVLSRIWSQVPESAVRLRDRAVTLLTDVTHDERLAVHWAMVIATHPFFTDIAETTGNLMSLHGRVALAQIQRRQAERWGERSTVGRATRRVLRSMVQWGVLNDTDDKGVYTAAPEAHSVRSEIAMLLLEALLIDSDQESVEVRQLLSHPSLFPFGIGLSPAQLRTTDRMEVHRQGLDNEVVNLANRQ